MKEYNEDELKDLMNLTEPFGLADIQKQERLISSRMANDKTMSTEKKMKISKFVKEIAKVLRGVIKSDFINTDPGRLMEHNDHMVIRRPSGKDQVSTRINAMEQEAPGSWARHTVHRLLCLDSKFRSNYFQSLSTDYLVNLPTVIRNCIKMELVALELPSSYYQISKELDNNFFWLGWHNKYYFVSIPDGNYHRTGMEDALNLMMQLATNAVVDIAPVCKIDVHTLRTTISLGAADKSSEKDLYLFFNRSPVGRSKTAPGTALEEPPSIEVTTEGGVAGKFGWMLGYRMGEYRGGEAYVSEGVYDAWGTKYLYIIVDDFNKNVNNFVCPAYHSSLGSANILARISTNAWTLGDFTKGLSLASDMFGDDTAIRTRDYFGPVNIQKLHIRVTDEYGRTINLNNMDMSMAIDLVCLYD